ncbi:MAG: NADH-quinone oxidoreductase subunit NuoE [Planctomycetes bacterium]|nr:NADH-quinone oxidoreductase subunit NuoE [Planctomycetota bacterium]
MLNDQVQKEIRGELEHYPTPRAACIEALKIVQNHERWVSDTALHDVADLIGIPAAELEGVATFYNLIYRQPVGKHVILLCDSVSCWLTGCGKIRAGIKERLNIDFGQTTADDRFTLLPMACLGNCDHAPSMMVGEVLHQDLTPESLDQILEGVD